MVIWIVGLSASGKTTLASSMYPFLKTSSEPFVFIDGDTFRHIMGEDLKHTLEDRKRNSERIVRMCEFLEKSGVNVLVSIMSMFPEDQLYMRSISKDYRQVYLKADIEKLAERDNKDIYKRAMAGELTDVAGVDMVYPEPVENDLIIDMNREISDFDTFALTVIAELGLEIGELYCYDDENRIDKPEKYQYSKVFGDPFLERYKEKRTDIIKDIDGDADISGYLKTVMTAVKEGHISTSQFLKNLIDDPKIEEILLLVKRFEVSKKVYEHYLPELKKTDSNYRNIDMYLLFALAIKASAEGLCEEDKDRLILMNALLKLNDIIISVKTDLNIQQKQIMKDSIQFELKMFNEYGEL